MPPHPPGNPEPWSKGEVPVYHITHVDNLASIVQSGEICCDNACVANGHSRVSIAYADLKDQRAGVAVESARGGTLADYVPFYYAPRSPMLYVSYTNYVPDYSGGQEPIVHLVFCLQDLAGSCFAMTDGHPISPLSRQFDSLDGLEAIDWPLMYETFWADTDDDGDRKRRRQAEFLAYSSVPIASVKLIGVMTKDIGERAAAALANLADPPPIIVREDWYY
jgi:hypothetical protein